MHKTASTTIQKRFEANGQLLSRHGYQFIAKERKALLKATLQKNFKPWRELVRNATGKGLTPIVSHEAFSHVLCRSLSRRSKRCLGDWLFRKLNDAGVDITIIGFIRDQPSYLNSHYTQHVKRFATAKSLEAYAAKAMRSSIHKSSCDPEQLFGWLEHQPSVRTVLFPYGRSITQPAALDHYPSEPFAQLIHCLGIPDSAQFQNVDNLNAQPGELAVHTALQLGEELRQEGIHLDRKTKKRARALICKEAELHQWTLTPFIGLSPELNSRIRNHFAAANNRFAQRVWGCPWDQIFTTEHLKEPRRLTVAERDEIRRAIKRVRPRLFPTPTIRDAIRNFINPFRND